MKQRRTILFLTNRVPFPPNKGDKIRTFHQLDHLAQSHDVYCACFVDSSDDLEHAEALSQWCKGVAAIRWNKTTAFFRAVHGWVGGRTLSQSAYRDKAMFGELARWSETIRFDSVVAFSTMMAPYALAVPARRRVLDMCDVDSQKWLDYAIGSGFFRSRILRSEGRRLRAVERQCLDVFDATILITDRERQIIDPAGQINNLHVIPNGVTLPVDSSPPVSRCEPVIGFLGAMDYRPNVEGICWFVHRSWPAILAEVPDARLMIVGRNPARPVSQLARTRGVEVVGEVADVQSYLRRCRVVVAPLHIARGLQNKVLEAMAVRRPVVATSAVADGLQVLKGRHILVADEAETFARKVADLCRFDALCQEIADAGYRRVAMYYYWPEALDRYERVVLGTPASSAQNLRERPHAATGKASERLATSP